MTHQSTPRPGEPDPHPDLMKVGRRHTDSRMASGLGAGDFGVQLAVDLGQAISRGISALLDWRKCHVERTRR